MKKAMVAALILLPLLAIALAAGATRTSSQPDDPVAIARQHLKQNSQQFGLRPELDDLRLLEVRESLGARHVRFQQTFGGVPVFAAYTTVNMSKTGSQVSLVLNRYKADLHPAVTQALVGSDQAIALAGEAVGLQGEPRGSVSAEQVYFAVEKTYFLAWQVQVPAREPLGDWLVIVRADNGEVLLKQDVAWTDSGRVFDPNPVKTGAPPPPPPPSDCDSAANELSLSPEYRTQTLLGIQAAQNKLKGQYVDLCAPGILGAYKPACQANEASRNYTYACNDDRFEEVMTYYHLDAAQRKIQSLGFTGNSSIINRPIPAHAHYFDDCNAFFSPWDRGLHFGDGNNPLYCTYDTDAAEDADVIVHEYGHAVQDDQVPAWGFGAALDVEQAGAMGEGFGDFLASAIYGDPCEGEWFSFGDTACGGQPGLRWLQNTKVYPADFEACPDNPDGSEEVHCTGEIWGGALWDLVEALGNNQAARDLALRLVLDSHFYLDPESTFGEGLSAIRQADQDLYGGSHISTINTVFAGRGITYVGSDPPPDFPYAYFRIRHTFVGDLVIRLKAGSNPASPLCNLLIWNHSGGSADDLAGYVDPTGSACAPYLPPSVGTPWWLEAQDTASQDVGYIGDFQVALSGSQRCVATDVPVNIPDAGSAVRSKVDCTTIIQPPTPTPTPPPTPGCTLSGPLTVVARDLPEAGPAPEQPPRLIPRLAPEKPADGAAAPETNVVDAAATRPLQALAPPDITNGFEGADFNDNAITLTPPDPQLAVGPNHVFEMVNITGRIFNKSGGVVDTFPLASFFDVPVGWFDFDPKIIYDDISDRWFASYASILDNVSGTDYGRLHLAVSQTSDPTGAWNVYACQYSDGNFADYPGIGVSDDKLTVSANIFDIDDSPAPFFAGVQTIVLQKSDVMAGDPSPGIYQFPYNTNRFTVRPAHSLSSTNDQYLAWYDLLSFTLLDYSRITGTPNAGNVTEQAAVQKTVLSQDSPPNSLTSGGGQIDSGDWRALEAIWRDGRLWVSASAVCTPSGDTQTRSCAHLAEINTAGAGTVVNDIMFGASGQYFSWPAIRTDAQGNLHVSLTHTTPSIWAEARVAGRLATDPANTMSGSTVLRAGEVLHDSGRWGDYMGAAVDPVGPHHVWVVGQYAKDTGASGPTGNWDWGTYIGVVSFDGTNCQVGVDTDGDTFNSDVECYVDTDPLDACPDWTATAGSCPGDTCNGDDAWPLDLNVDTAITVPGDVLAYRGKIGCSVGSNPECQRLDLNADDVITVPGDVLKYRGMIGATCT